MRALIKQVDPDVVQEWKWRGVPVWWPDGMVCTGEACESVVKMTFAQGATLDDACGLFNSSLEESTRQAIALHEVEMIDVHALSSLYLAAAALNEGVKKAK